MKMITVDMLLDKNAYFEQIQLFISVFGKSAVLSVANMEKAISAGLRFTWLECFLSASQMTEYRKIRDAALVECDKICYVATAECDEICDAALAECEKICDAATAECEKICGAALLKILSAQ